MHVCRPEYKKKVRACQANQRRMVPVMAARNLWLEGPYKQGDLSGGQQAYRLLSLFLQA